MSTQPTKEELIADLQGLVNDQENDPSFVITRDYYRYNGAFSERSWQKHFAKFKDFVASADIKPEKTIVEQEPVESVSELKGDSWEVSLPCTNLRTVEEVAAYYKLDLAKWKVDKFYTTSTESGGKESYSIKATFSPISQLVGVKEELERMKDDFKGFVPVRESIVRTARESGNILEILIPDLHLAKLANAKETGYQNYDLKIAEKTYERAVSTILDRAKGYTFDRIVLGLGNDVLQMDNYSNQTTKGTPVDTDGRFPKAYVAARKMFVRTIEKLRLIAPVDVLVIPGNHDAQTSFTLGDSLECWFHNDPEVNVDNSPTPHKFYTWGDVFLMLLHGHKGKKSDYGMRMATEKAKEWGNSKFREIHVGHTHGLDIEEKYGVRLRTFSALCPPDFWHSEGGLTGNLRSAEGLVWNKKEGCIASFIHTEID